MSDTSVQCAQFSLNGQTYGGGTFVFEDRGGNVCGCPPEEAACKVSTVELAPPEAPTFP